MSTDAERRKALMSQDTSRMNKLWLAQGWKHDGMLVEWKWQGAEHKSRLLFSFDGGPFLKAKSYDDDVRPFLFDGDSNWCSTT